MFYGKLYLAANNMVSLDEIKEINLLVSIGLRISMIVYE
jgi:hypothetical protein